MKLGLNKRYNVSNDESSAWIEFESPNEIQYLRFQSELATIFEKQQADADSDVSPDTDLGKSITVLCIESAKELLADAGGFEVPTNMSQLDAVNKFAAPQLAEIGKRIFMDSDGARVELDMGKAVKDSGRTTKGKSAA